MGTGQPLPLWPGTYSGSKAQYLRSGVLSTLTHAQGHNHPPRRGTWGTEGNLEPDSLLWVLLKPRPEAGAQDPSALTSPPPGPPPPTPPPPHPRPRNSTQEAGEEDPGLGLVLRQTLD